MIDVCMQADTIAKWSLTALGVIGILGVVYSIQRENRFYREYNKMQLDLFDKNDNRKK